MKISSKIKKSQPVRFTRLFFSAYFKSSTILTLCIVVIFLMIIDNLLFSMRVNDHTLSTESINSSISKQIDAYMSLSDVLCRDEALISLVQSLENKSLQEQLYISHEISDMLQNMLFATPEISHATILTSATEITGFPSVYPLSRVKDTPLGNALRKNYTTLFDQYSLNINIRRGNYTDHEKVSILSPIQTKGYDEPMYLCISIPKFFFFTEYLSDSSSDKYIVNSDGTIISTSNLTLIGKTFENKKLTSGIASSHDTININNRKHMASISSANEYGWKVISLTPVSEIRTWIPMLIAILFLICIIIFISSLVFSHRFSKKLTQPLQTLIDYINLASPADTQDSNIIEINDLYNKYNSLINDNDSLMSEIKVQQENRTKAEMKALVSQINPHFLYNTLNVISWKAFEKDCPELCTIIGKLGKLCRSNYHFKSMQCNLRDEIIGINLYLDLQKECFNNSFDYVINIPKDCLNLTLPRFILQPIVENAVMHGFSQIINRGQLTISAHLNDKLIIKIEDNGIGITPDVLEKLNSGKFFSERYGLSNVNERIKLYCGEEYGLSFTSHSYKSTIVTVTLPIIPFEEN